METAELQKADAGGMVEIRAEFQSGEPTLYSVHIHRYGESTVIDCENCESATKLFSTLTTSDKYALG